MSVKILEIMCFPCFRLLFFYSIKSERRLRLIFEFTCGAVVGDFLGWGRATFSDDAPPESGLKKIPGSRSPFEGVFNFVFVVF